MSELRERMIRAAFDAFYAEGTPYNDVERAMFGQVVDAVLSTPGEVDVERLARTAFEQRLTVGPSKFAARLWENLGEAVQSVYRNDAKSFLHALAAEGAANKE